MSSTKIDLSKVMSKPAAVPLRVCCYGSSSAKTPEKYLKEARALGYALALRGHTCVNGAGSAGCMAAMNAGAAEGDGHIVGVIHEMFVVDGSDWVEEEGGANKVFRNIFHGEATRELITAGGNDLQERKRLLVEGANALVVLPGGPGTWDELWEMACARNIGLSNLPIVCVNVDGYYENFRQMLQRAYEDELIRFEPHEIVHFEQTAEDAVRWIETQCTAADGKAARPEIKKRNAALLQREESVLAPMSWIKRTMSFSFRSVAEEESTEQGFKSESSSSGSLQVPVLTAFAAGVLIGASVITQLNRRG